MSTLRSYTKACIFLMLWAAMTLALPAQTLQTLHAFAYTDGEYPWAPLVQASDGNLYGTTSAGGNPCASGGYATGCGTIFQITPGGSLSTFFSFDGTNGSAPFAGLVQAPNGDFYGVTSAGGTFDGDGDCPFNCGTVFKITASGTLTTLYNFNWTDGDGPEGTLLLATDGNYYGTTSTGGLFGGGTVFVITPGGTLTTLYNFNGATDGFSPYASLIQALDGNLYGTTWTGGANQVGTVFKITTGGTLTTLHSFNNTDGALPFAGLVQAKGGDFFGVTEEGGAYSYGTVFKITPLGKLTTLHSFAGGVDGDTPISTLIRASDGNYYGTASYDGLYPNFGTIFQITRSGTMTTLYNFDSTDGDYPYAPLFQATNGGFYGTTTYGGSSNCQYGYGCGTAFSLSMGLGPFVETAPTSGKVGTAVRILGTDLTGATGVTFNGLAAAFTVVSSSEITSNVPVGATTGEVKVKMRATRARLKSNVAFQVTQ